MGVNIEDLAKKVGSLWKSFSSFLEEYKVFYYKKKHYKK